MRRKLFLKLVTAMSEMKMKEDKEVADKELEQIRRKKIEELTQSQSQSEFPDKPITLSGENVEDVGNKFPLLVVDCWAEWCPPCRILAPIIDELADDYSGEAVFGKLNVDDGRKFARKYNVKSIPTLLFFKNGKLADRIIGAVPKNQIEQKIKELTREET